MVDSLIERTVDTVEQLLYLVTRGSLLSDASAYAQLDTAIGGDYNPSKEGRAKVTPPDTLVTKMGDLASVMRVSGTMRMITDEVKHPSAVDFCTRIAKYWSVYLKRSGHPVDVIFDHDPTNVRKTIRRYLRPGVNASVRMKLDMTDIFEGKEDALAKWCATDCVHIAIFSDYSLLSQQERKNAIDEAVELAKKTGYVAGDLSSQDFFAINRALISRHNNFCDQFKADMNKAGIIVDHLNGIDACRMIRSSIDPENTADDWRPVLPGDPFRPRMERNGKAQLLPEKLSLQLMPRKATCEGETVRVGKRYFASTSLDRGPLETEMFGKLFSRVPRDLPWRAVFQLRAEGMRHQSFAKNATSILGFLPSLKPIKASFDYLEEAKKAGDIDLGMRVTFQTWAKSRENAESNLNAICGAVQGWGSCDTSERFGDPILGWVGAIPLFSDRSGAKTLPIPISEAVRMLPLSMPASPWRDGSIVYRTPEGQLFPYQPGSSLQDTWFDLYFAPPGSGKSSTMNSNNLATIFGPGVQRIPYMSFQDIGPSSLGVIETVQAALPEHQKHLAKYILIKNDPEFAINPFDTFPGCRQPSEKGKLYLKALLVTFGTPIGKEEPYESVEDLADKIIKLAYDRFSDMSEFRKMYEPDVDPEVDSALQNLTVPKDPSWWEVTDILWRAGLQRESTLAQRYAVPTLMDLPSVCSAKEIKDIYLRDGREVKIPSGEPLISAMERLITAAGNRYKVLSTTTRFDLGEARIVSLDLNDVAPDGGPAEKRESEVFMMFARHVLMRNILINVKTAEGLCELCPPIYHAYHMARGEELESTMKVYSVDELHRSKGNRQFRALLKQDGREGRKWFLKIGLSSQFMSDFDDEMIGLASSIYAMRYIDDMTSKELRERFGFSDTAIERYKYECLGPVPGYGAPFLVLFKTNVGTIEQILVNTMSTIESWALTTKAEDRSLRRAVYARLPGNGKLARQALTAMFPTGSVKAEYEQRSLTYDQKQGGRSLFEVMADEVVSVAHKIAQRQTRKEV